MPQSHPTHAIVQAIVTPAYEEVVDTEIERKD